MIIHYIVLNELNIFVSVNTNKLQHFVDIKYSYWHDFDGFYDFLTFNLNVIKFVSFKMTIKNNSNND